MDVFCGFCVCVCDVEVWVRRKEEWVQAARLEDNMPILVRGLLLLLPVSHRISEFNASQWHDPPYLAPKTESEFRDHISCPRPSSFPRSPTVLLLLLVAFLPFHFHFNFVVQSSLFFTSNTSSSQPQGRFRSIVAPRYDFEPRYSCTRFTSSVTPG